MTFNQYCNHGYLLYGYMDMVNIFGHDKVMTHPGASYLLRVCLNNWK